MSGMSDFKTRQQQLVRAMREPDYHFHTLEADGERRLAVYQNLLFNNIRSFITSGFPVLRSILNDPEWDTLIRHFYKEHKCTSPYFVEITKEFNIYLSQSPKILSQYPPFMTALAHYEWLELDVSVRDIPMQPVQQRREGSFVMSDLASLVSYDYPVHLISKDHQPQPEAGETYSYVVFRDRVDEVHFILLAPMTALLLSLITESELPPTEDEILHQLNAFITSDIQETASSNLPRTLAHFVEQGILIKASSQTTPV